MSRRFTTIRRWHWGKIVILWSWGGVLAGLLLTAFLSTRPREHPALALGTLLASLTLVVLLSALTWVWLGGKEQAAP